MAILNDIIDWIEDKPIFWQHAISKIIRNNSITEEDIIELKEICKKDYGISSIEFENVDLTELRDFITDTDQINDLFLSKISNVQNINAIKDQSELIFSHSGLCVIYGDNGSGKSSYVCILKHVCNTRGSLPSVNNNLYNPNSNEIDHVAKVEYSTDGNNFQTVEYLNGEISETVLKGIDVFDAYSASHYIEGEDEIAFIPTGLSIIEKFAKCIQRIEEELNAEIRTLELSKFDYSLLQLNERSSGFKFLNNISHETSIDELRSNSSFNEQKSNRLSKLREDFSKLKLSDPKRLFKENVEKIGRLIILKNKLENLEAKLTGDSLSVYKETLNGYVSASETLTATSTKTFSNLPLKGVGSDTWKQLWESARKFYNESIESELFPDTSENSRCPLCLRELSPEAKLRFSNFEDFIKLDVQKEYDTAFIKLNDIVNKIKSLSFDFSELEPIIAEVSELKSNYIDVQKDFLSLLSKQRDEVLSTIREKRIIESLEEPEFDTKPTTLISEIISDLNNTNEKLQKQSIERNIESVVNELIELKDEKKIYDFKPKIAREICRSKKVKLLNDCISKCYTRGITLFSNSLANTYVTETLKDNFKKELEKLGFRNINIETGTRGIRGKQYHFLKLNEPNANNLALKDILSEGEHRCISLATFFSELSISENNSSIVFDDPVSSLDHKWRKKISNRIVEEAKERQIIVFTHDITFLMLLQEFSEKLICDIEIKSLTRNKMETGIVAQNPPWDALPVRSRIGILKNELQTLEKIERTETEEIYRERVKPFYGKLRETWERFVEEVLLNKAVQRFGREIQTKRVKVLSDITDADYKIIEDNMSKCSTYMLGHDSAGTLIENMPEAKEVKEDLNILEDYLIEMRKNRKRN